MCDLSLPVVIVPTAPQNLNLMDFTYTGATLSVTLTWRRPDPPNGLITQYNVSDTTNSYYLIDNNSSNRYLMLLQTYKMKLLMIILLFCKLTVVVVVVVVLIHLIHGMA